MGAIGVGAPVLLFKTLPDEDDFKAVSTWHCSYLPHWSICVKADEMGDDVEISRGLSTAGLC
jgi:hypothetical protein